MNLSFDYGRPQPLKVAIVVVFLCVSGSDKVVLAVQFLSENWMIWMENDHKIDLLDASFLAFHASKSSTKTTALISSI